MTAERTLTGLPTPLGAGAERDTAVFSLVGDAAHVAPPPGGRVHLVGAGLVIGRAPTAAAGERTLLTADPQVSSRHARIAPAGPAVWTAEDLGSKNGTQLDGRPLTEARPLPSGALLLWGGHAGVFRLASHDELGAVSEDLLDPLGPVATANPELAVVCGKLRRLAPSSAEVLLVGETGAGKEVYARAVHTRSGRTGRFVAINCAALPRDLVESELFGFRHGAHSTAHRDKPGLIEEAEGGTLFLDEIGEMPPEAQTKLLRFLQDRELLPLGATRPRRIDVRVMAATSRPVSVGGEGALRDDLLGRLGGDPVRLPPLRDRIEDLGVLAAHLLVGRALTFEPAAFRALCLYAWPLNVRELGKVLETCLAFTGGTRAVGLRDLPEAIAATTTRALRADAPTSTSTSTPAPDPGAAARGPSPTSEQIDVLLARHAGNVADVARDLGKQRAAVWRWIKKYGLDVDKHRR